MTYAPANLKAVRALLLQHLDIHENSSAYPTDLDPAEVGIVGDPAHRGGYHCGSDRVDLDDYSVRESSRDRTGLTLAACALDEGWWETRVGGKTHNLRTHSIWLVAQCKANTPDTRDIREVIYSPDGVTVKRWDRLGKRSGGDSSHLWHTHRSYFRDAIKAGRDLTAIDRRYLQEIGLLAGGEDDMNTSQNNALAEDWAVAAALRDGTAAGKAGNHPGGKVWLVEQVRAMQTQLATVASKVGVDQVDEEAIVDGVLAGLGSKDLDDVATALRAAFGVERAAELGAKLATPQATATPQ